VITKRPRRLDGVSYVGYARYFVTSCTESRRRAFASEPEVEDALSHLRHCCELFGFSLPAYCFMADHVHLLLVAESEGADLCALVKRFKQLTGFAYKRRTGHRLWQHGYHERILRNNEETLAITRYVLENPVRAGLAKAPGEYPFAGSHVYDWPALLEAWESADARQT
jgi:REP-associated tyrosine transposase